MENISRRNFLTLGAMGAAGVAASGLVGCAPQTASEGAASAAGAGAEGSTGTINCSGIVVDPATVNEVYSTDILVVGGGLSGLAAAVEATQAGDSMILLEGQATLGGNGQGVEGTFAVNSRFQQEQGITIEPWEIMQEELGKTQWVANGLLYKDLMDHAADNLHWLVDECGCELEGKIDNYPCGTGEGKVDSFHWWKEGVAYLGYVLPMEKKLREAGADIRLNTRGLEFSYDESGAINGVYAQDAFGDIVKFEAKQIIIATGGFADDDARLTKMGFDLTTLDRVGMPGHWGDGVNMTVAAGAAEFPGVCYLKYNCISHMTETFGAFWGAFAFGGPFLWLNPEGDRFVDESVSYRVGNITSQTIPIHTQGGVAFSVFDESICNKIIEDNLENAAAWETDLREELEAMIAAGDDVWRADSLAEVAKLAGLDPEKVQAQVDEYNGYCEAKHDSMFGKDAEYLLPIQEGPFYIALVHERMEGPLGGVQTNRNFQPILRDGGVLENVYVVGLDGIMLYRDVYPMDVPGSASAECIFSARSAAQQAHAKLNA